MMRAIDDLVKDRFMFCEDADDAPAAKGNPTAAIDRAALPRQWSQEVISKCALARYMNQKADAA